MTRTGSPVGNSGLKTEAPDRLWSLEAAAYHLKWKDIQLFAIVNDIGINANGGKARINGVEFSGPCDRCAASASC